MQRREPVLEVTGTNSDTARKSQKESLGLRWSAQNHVSRIEQAATPVARGLSLATLPSLPTSFQQVAQAPVVALASVNPIKKTHEARSRWTPGNGPVVLFFCWRPVWGVV